LQLQAITCKINLLTGLQPQVLSLNQMTESKRALSSKYQLPVVFNHSKKEVLMLELNRKGKLTLLQSVKLLELDQK
jgi:hypothetical protein